jgi:L-threonylcarbamoyladenylate synthase
MKILEATDENIGKAAAVIRSGGVVAYPTETVYGIGCIPGDKDASQRVCEIKARADNPLPLICSDVNVACKVVDFNVMADRLAERFWPGPLILVLEAKMKFGMWVTHGATTLGVRVSSHPVASKLAKLSEGVIVGTSVDVDGKLALTANDALEQFGRKVDMILDGGPCPGIERSTVLDLTSDELWILRKGPITGEQIREALKDLPMNDS